MVYACMKVRKKGLKSFNSVMVLDILLRIRLLLKIFNQNTRRYFKRSKTCRIVLCGSNIIQGVLKVFLSLSCHKTLKNHGMGWPHY